MPAKSAAAKELERKTEHGLSKAEACKALQVAPSADEELITQAYWHQARKVRGYAHLDPKARERLDELNRAYRVLNPGRAEAPLEREMKPSKGGGLFEAMTGWLQHISLETALRWPGRATEVAVLGGTTAGLTLLAFNAGADPIWTLVIAGIAAVTIWAPWRKA
jgi:hypothetical protein